MLDGTMLSGAAERHLRRFNNEMSGLRKLALRLQSLMPVLLHCLSISSQPHFML
jgi:hypothetical protein